MTRLIKREPKRILKREKKRIIQRKLHFIKSPKGAIYCKTGCVTGFWEENYFYLIIRNGHLLQWKKVYHYGVKMKIPKWVTSTLRRKECHAELAMLEELRGWIENGPHSDPTRLR